MTLSSHGAEVLHPRPRQSEPTSPAGPSPRALRLIDASSGVLIDGGAIIGRPPSPRGLGEGAGGPLRERPLRHAISGQSAACSSPSSAGPAGSPSYRIIGGWIRIGGNSVRSMRRGRPCYRRPPPSPRPPDAPPLPQLVGLVRGDRPRRRPRHGLGRDVTQPARRNCHGAHQEQATEEPLSHAWSFSFPLGMDGRPVAGAPAQSPLFQALVVTGSSSP